MATLVSTLGGQWGKIMRGDQRWDWGRPVKRKVNRGERWVQSKRNNTTRRGAKSVGITSRKPDKTSTAAHRVGKSARHPTL